MERGEKGGMVLDNSDSAEDVVPGDGGAIDTEIAAIEKDNHVVDVEGGDANPDGGREIPQDGEVDEGETIEANPKGEEPGVQDQNRVVADEIIKAVKASFPIPEKVADTVKPMTEEQWVSLEQEWGQPRQTIQKITSQNVQVVNKLIDYIDSKFSKIEVGEAIQNLSKDPGFTDAGRYKDSITDFLSDYEQKHWSNPALLKKAVIYSRGLNANKNVQRARVETERNKKIAGAARPSSPSGGMRRVAAPALTGAHKEVAAIMGSESEYQKFRSRPSRTIE